MADKVRIVVDDREDATTIELPDNFYGHVELCFKAGVMVTTKQTAVAMKRELKGNRTNATTGTHVKD